MKARALAVGVIAPGSALAVVIALAATFLTELHGGPQMLYALFLGVAFHYLSDEPRTRPGIDFCSQQVLRLGVGLLGARITAEQIAGLGWFTALTVVAAVVTTIACGLLLARWLGMSRAQGVLSGGAVAICGASAAMAISAVLPRQKHHERFTLMVVITVTVLSTVAMVLYPLLARGLGLGPELAGLFIGGTIHDVAQVVGAGFTLGPQTGEVATIVKLFRVAMLAAVVMAASVAFKRAREQAAAAAPSTLPTRQPLVPWFLWLFIALVAVNSAGALAAPLQHGLGWLSRACLVVAIAALGMKTSLKHLAEAGWRPVLLILVETLWMAALVVGLILSRL
ncbi:MAG: YeiH family protein [Rubrivivax sp.]